MYASKQLHNVKRLSVIGKTVHWYIEGPFDLFTSMLITFHQRLGLCIKIGFQVNQLKHEIETNLMFDTNAFDTKYGT